MAHALTIVVLGGSLSSASRSRAALLRALDGAEAAGGATRLFDIRELDLPMYNPDAGEPTGSATELIEGLHAADGMLWSSPLYQGTISGALKNALDWLHLLGDRDPPYLKDKVIGLISAAGGTQGLQAINTMEFSVRALRAWAVPYVVPVASAARVFDREGGLHDEQRAPVGRHATCGTMWMPAASKRSASSSESRYAVGAYGVWASAYVTVAPVRRASSVA